MFPFADGSKNTGWFKDFDVLLPRHIKPKINSIKQKDTFFLDWKEYDFALGKKKQTKTVMFACNGQVRQRSEVLRGESLRVAFYLPVLFQTLWLPQPFFFLLSYFSKEQRQSRGKAI